MGIFGEFQNLIINVMELNELEKGSALTVVTSTVPENIEWCYVMKDNVNIGIGAYRLGERYPETALIMNKNGQSEYINELIGGDPESETTKSEVNKLFKKFFGRIKE